MKTTRARPVHLIAVALALISSTTPASANEYRYEVQAAYGDQDGSSTDVRTRALTGRYYFSMVDDSSGPLALAPFITRASGMAVFGADRKSKFDPQLAFTPISLTPNTAPPTLDGVSDFFPVGGVLLPPGVGAISFALPGPSAQNERYGLGLNYVFDNAWIVEGELAIDDARSEAFVSRQTDDGLTLEVGAGRYVRELMSVTLTFRYSDLETDSTILTFSCLPGTPCSRQGFPFSNGKIIDRAWSLSSRYVLPQGDMFHEFTGAATYGTRSGNLRLVPLPVTSPIEAFPLQFDLDRWELAAGYTFYPRTDWGVGVDLVHLDTETDQLQSFSVHGTWFVTPAIALGLSYMRSYTDTGPFEISDEDTDGFELSLTGRF